MTLAVYGRVWQLSDFIQNINLCSEGLTGLEHREGETAPHKYIQTFNIVMLWKSIIKMYNLFWKWLTWK